MNERWKEIPGYGGDYEVSNLGMVRSYKRNTSGEMIKPQTNRGGYLYVNLYKNKKPKSRSLASAVSEVFIGIRPRGLQINHIDGNKKNNSVENLEYITSSENVKHAWRTGLSTHKKGELSHHSKLKNIDVLIIRHLRGKMKAIDISSLFDISVSNVSRIQTGKRWTHI